MTDAAHGRRRRELAKPGFGQGGGRKAGDDCCLGQNLARSAPEGPVALSRPTTVKDAGRFTDVFDPATARRSDAPLETYKLK